MKKVHHAAIDRIVENIAVIGFKSGEILEVPSSILPDKSAEGKVLRITIEVDEEETDRLKNEVRNLQQELLNRNKK